MDPVPSDVKLGSVARRIDPAEMHSYRKSVKTPRAGDLVLARVGRIGRHAHLESRSGRPLALYPNDLIVGVFGTHHDADEFEGVVPVRLQRSQLLAPAGVVGQVQARNRRVESPTELDPLGFIFDEEGVRIELSRRRLRARAAASVPTILVLGSDRLGGRSATMTSVVHLLAASGLSVGAARITGTASRVDVLRLRDAGADRVLDFSAFGFPSTYLLGERELSSILASTLGHLAGARCEVVVLEMGNDLFQRETEIVLESEVAHAHVDAVLYSAGDVVSAHAARDRLTSRYELPLLAVSGTVAESALGIREVEDGLGVACFNPWDSAHGTLVQALAVAFPDLIQTESEDEDESAAAERS